MSYLMQIHYRVVEQDGRYLASCSEVEVEAWGRTTAEALEALLRHVRGALYSDEAVAPPSHAAPKEAIELVEEASRTPSEDGPGDPPPAPDTPASAG